MSKTDIGGGEKTIQSTTEQFQFVQDEVSVIVNESIEKVLGPSEWDPNCQEQWNNRIMELVLEGVAALKKPYKYMVHCTTMQRTGSCLHVSNACYWDGVTDGSVTVRWENPFMYAVVSVFGLFV